MEPATGTLAQLELTAEDLALVESGLKLLLMIEDDHETVARLKELIAQVRREIENPQR
jgi:hypothetical protein